MPEGHNFAQPSDSVFRETWRPETIALHGGSYHADPATGAVALPIYQTTSFQFQDTGHAARLFALEGLGGLYTRVTNPTQDAFEHRRNARLCSSLHRPRTSRRHPERSRSGA